MVRAKLQLTSIRELGHGQQSFGFEARYDPDIPEDQRFAKYTPTGSFQMTVDNPAAQAQFTKGEYYYFDISPVPKPVLAPEAGS
jgi:hypothetical protein